MATSKLTQAAVERLKPPADGQIEYFDSAWPGLALRVTARGVKSWVFFGRVGGRLRRVTLGRWPAMGLKDARVSAGETADAMRAGVDPTAAKRAARLAAATAPPATVRALGALYIERDARPRLRTWREIAATLELHVYSRIGERDPATVTRRDVLELLDAVADGGARVRANRVLAYTRRLFNWAVERDILAASPVAGIKTPARETARERLLDDDELRALLGACEAVGAPFGALVRLLLLTGQRLGEVRGARWSELDLASGWWHLPGERTKNRRPHDVPLSRQALEVIAALPRRHGSDLLFPAVFTRARRPARGAGERPVSGLSRAKARLDRLMDAELRKDAQARGEDGAAVALPPWRLHDLRRNTASGLARLGIAVHVTEKLLNHASGTFSSIVEVYQIHDFSAEKRIAAQAWADQLTALVAGAPGANVVSIRGAAS
jgi:integrase